MIARLAATCFLWSALLGEPAAALPRFYIAGDIAIQEGALEVAGGSAFESSYALSRDAGGHLRLGYRIDDAWRVEAEAAHRVSDINEVCYANFGCVSSSGFGNGDFGDFERSSLHVNLLRDLPPVVGGVRPFVGVGVGATRVSLERGGLLGRGDDVAWSGQLIAGSALALSPRLSLDVTYRYVRVFDVKVYGTYGAPVPCGPPPPPCPPPPPPPDGINVGMGPSGPTNGDDHILSLGLRYVLGRVD